jgi:IS4 transposase
MHQFCRFFVACMHCDKRRGRFYDSLYRARAQAENLFKLHKTQLAFDRTSCRSAVRLTLD